MNKIENVTIYVAFDGSKFFTEESCKSYELALQQDREETEIMDFLRGSGVRTIGNFTAPELRNLSRALLDGFIMVRKYEEVE